MSWYETAYPSFLLRVVENEGRTTGAVHLLYRAGPHYAQSVRAMYPTCVPAADGPGHAHIGRCRVQLLREAEWTATLLATLDAEGIWTIPEQAADRYSGASVFDGGGIAVEVRRGALHRRYVYDNPDSLRFPAHARVMRIGAAADDALRRALPRAP
jgi:hypothetical protein